MRDWQKQFVTGLFWAAGGTLGFALIALAWNRFVAPGTGSRLPAR